MSKGTIVYIGGFELPDKNAAAHRVIGNGKALRDLGYNVVFIGVDKGDGDTATVGKKESVFGFESYKRKNPTSFGAWLSDFFNADDYLKIVDRYSDAKCIIAYNFPSLLLKKLKAYCKKHKLALYADCTEWYDIKLKGNSLPKYLIRSADVFFRMRVIQPKLDGVIAISQYLHNYYTGKGTKTIQIPPLVDSKDPKWARNEMIKENNVPQILYAGTPFSLYKEPSYKDRIDLIILALYELKKDSVPFFMHIVGVQRDEVERNFPVLTEAIEVLSDSIAFYGKVSHLKVIETLKGCDYSLFLRYNTRSVKAGFPTKFTESISCGIPVLTNKNSNVANYLTEGKNGFFVDITSVETIKESLQTPLKLNRPQIEELKETCRKSNMFDYRKFISDFERFIEQ